MGAITILQGVKQSPFEDEWETAYRKLLRAVRRGLSAIGENVDKRLVRETKGITDIPEDEEFWNGQKVVFFGETGTLPNQLLLQGALQAERLELMASFDLVNQGVLELAGVYMNDWWKRLEGTTRDAMRAAIQAHIETGAPLPILRKNLEPLFGKARAETIATTETTRLFAEGNTIAYRASGVEEVEWRTVNDGDVCEECDGQDGQRFPIGGAECPAHPRCRCWLAPVVNDRARTEAT